MEYAAPRRNWTPGGDADDLANWMTEELQRNPSYQIPEGYRIVDGQVKRESPHWMQRNPWIYPLIGMGIGGGLGAMSLAGGAPAAAAATGVTTGPTLAQAGLAGAGGGLGGIIEMIAKVGGPAAITALTRRHGNPNGPYDGGMGGGPMGDQLSEIMALAKRRMERTEPVHEAAMNQIMRMQPGTAGYGRVQEASQHAMQPTPQQGMSPQVAEAYQRLMERSR